MDTSRTWRPALGPILCWLLPTIAACQSSPADVREWTPKDHTNTGGATTVTTQAPAARADGPAADDPGPPPGLDSVTLAAWTSNCSSCHGKIGRGDGPQGAMLKATDLSDPDWQKRVTDEQIRASITAGKNQMPAFPNLPSTTVDHLVLLVRWFNSDEEALKQRLAAFRGSQRTNGSASAPPPPSAPPASVGTVSSTNPAEQR